MSADWKDWKPYPYKGHTLSNPQYIKDRDTLFVKHGNGWWWGRGWWSDEPPETPMELQRKYRKEREEENDKTRNNK